MVNLFIANTDNEWFDFLSSQVGLQEANFWQPSGKTFRAVREGELLVFRLKSPRNKIGGFGVFNSSTVLPLQTAWETFGNANGAPSYEALQTAIVQYHPHHDVGPATNIGCRILTQVTFLPSYLWIALPPHGHKILWGESATLQRNPRDFSCGAGCRKQLKPH
jgi:putative restriction endonuclease